MATRLRELGPATYTSRDVVDVPVPDAAEVLRVLADARRLVRRRA
jgi:hypothetical protein